MSSPHIITTTNNVPLVVDWAEFVCERASSSGPQSLSYFADPKDLFECLREDDDGGVVIVDYDIPYSHVAKQDQYGEELFLAATIVH